MRAIITGKNLLSIFTVVALSAACFTLGFKRADLNTKIEGAAFTRYYGERLILADLSLAVVRLTVITPGREVKRATGFFFEHNSELYLITNRHVVLEETDDVDYYADELILKIHNDPGDLAKSGYHYVKLLDDDGNRVWLEHPTYKSEVDVIAIPLGDIFKKGDFLIGAFEKEDLPTKEDVFPVAEDVAIIGYPFGISDEYFNLPIIRKGTVASFYPIHFENEPYFYVDTRLHKGSSGSPVLAKPGALRIVRGRGTDTSTRGKVYLLGVNSGRLPLEDKLKELYYDEDEPFRTLDLNQVWYAELITDIIEQKSK